MKFKDLQDGDKFIFDSEILYPYSGMAKGPWRKISARRYVLDSPDIVIVHHIGSINAGVILQEEPCQL